MKIVQRFLQYSIVLLEVDLLLSCLKLYLIFSAVKLYYRPAEKTTSTFVTAFCGSMLKAFL